MTGRPWLSAYFEYGLAVLVLVVLSIQAWDPPLSQTALSRLATVLALSDDGTWYIDRLGNGAPNPFAVRTVDKVEVEGRLLSSKPPLLPLLMTGTYRALNGSADWSLDNMPELKRILYAMTLVFVAVPWAVAVAFAARVLRRSECSGWTRGLVLVGIALGSQAFGFGGVFNNHVPAAAMLIISFAGVFGLVSTERPSALVAVAAGLCGGLTAAFDPPNAIYVAAMGAALLVRANPAVWLAYGVGAAVPVVAQSVLLFRITGSPLPVQMHPDWYLYEASYWRNPLGVDAASEPRGAYLFHTLLGSHGIFVLFPSLALGLVGFCIALGRKSAFRTSVLAAVLCFGVVVTYYALRTDNYGGESYGMRWYIASMPALSLAGIPLLERARSLWSRGAVCVLLAVSMASAWHCALDPWRADREWLPNLLGF